MPVAPRYCWKTSNGELPHPFGLWRSRYTSKTIQQPTERFNYRLHGSAQSEILRYASMMQSSRGMGQAHSDRVDGSFLMLLLGLLTWLEARRTGNPRHTPS